VTRLPQISGKELVKILGRVHFVVIKQTGSHIKLARKTATGTETLTVPNHKTIKKGTLHGILKYAGLSSNDVLKNRKR